MNVCCVLLKFLTAFILLVVINSLTH